ncbi:tRNA (adenosine(37)-N6)-threonylcarbamoyltransferase complex ATPase subunit type 1 TsaE, partial [Candidatus Microgenomates bacterium]|nr:tRNA (adenosine(37)-N6)-threonylcarbamoyltransferase complex ATPase subunit type 1 TsaE [Candidatus Microgenomates bacterium]
TTFVQGMAVGLGVKQRIISPTFVIVRSYPFDKLRAGKLEVRSFYHIDLYRIDGRNNIEGLGLEEIINDSQNIVAVEWAERMGKLLPKNRIDIYFEHIDEHKRRITIKRSN